jgi:hypothetical protein
MYDSPEKELSNAQRIADKLNYENNAGKLKERLPILVERGNRYGSFSGHALLTQQLKRVFYDHLKNHNPTAVLTLAEKEAIDMIMHKLGRIGNGDPHYADSWVDIAGYATLIVEELKF